MQDVLWIRSSKYFAMLKVWWSVSCHVCTVGIWNPVSSVWGVTTLPSVLLHRACAWCALFVPPDNCILSLESWFCCIFLQAKVASLGSRELGVTYLGQQARFCLADLLTLFIYLKPDLMWLLCSGSVTWLNSVVLECVKLSVLKLSRRWQMLPGRLGKVMPKISSWKESFLMCLSSHQPY